MISPGEVSRSDDAETGVHLVRVASRASLNAENDPLAVLCTSARFDQRRHLPNCVAFDAGEFGFTRDCVARGDSVVLLTKAQL